VVDERLEGTVKRILVEKGYAFLTGPHGDVFMHRSASDPQVFDTLLVGERVTYVERHGPKGLKAEDVIPLFPKR
jgi:cold shock CspA family protein